MNEGQQKSDGGIGLVISFALLMFLVPYATKTFLLPYYATGWYWFKFYTLKGVWHASTLPYGEIIFEYVFSWVRVFIWDMTIPIGQVHNILTQSLDKLLEVDATSPQSIARSIFLNGDMRNEFIMVGRFHFAMVAPIYLFVLYKIAKHLRGVKEYTTVFSLDSFAETLSEGFPELLPVVYSNPQKWGDLDVGPWRMSPKVFKYMKDNGCLDITEDYKGMRFTIKEQNVKNLLIEQLEDKWQGYDKLPISYYRIAATAMPMVVSPSKGKKDTDKLISLFAYGHSSKPTGMVCLKKALKMAFSPQTYITKKGAGVKGVFSAFAAIPAGFKEGKRQRASLKEGDALARKIIEQNKDHPKVMEATSIHAYNLTVVSSLIEGARSGGVLPSCSSLWLKMHDRRLFYAFNNLGRQVAWVEVVGFWSHYLAEKTVKVPFPYPKVQNGVEGIDDYFYYSFDNYDPLLEYDD